MATAEDFLETLHPALRVWFERRFPEGPTPPQLLGWPEIAQGRDALICAPTGSGKTLTGFLLAIDRLYRAHEAGALEPFAVQVVYVSPLKALTVDIHKNLELPLLEIAEVARELGLSPPELRVSARSGDTPAKDRARMLKAPPHFLITTPESLYLLVTSERSREALRSVRTVIVDEIHAVAKDKRGAHLALTLERLEHLCERPQQRIGLSATQRPIMQICRLLVGTEERAASAAVIDVGHGRPLDLAIELPDSELEAVASQEQLEQVLSLIAEHVKSRRTTLIFVNTRRLSERLAHLLAERLGPDNVAAHHGSLSKDRRHSIEQRLRAGELSALVATASLELGLDIGPIELVCQIGSPRSIATFLQRVGRSGHSRFGTPVGRLYPLTRDELVECVALLRAVRKGRLDAIVPPRAPLDILAQQVIAECACEDWQEEELFLLARRAAPYADLSRQGFEAVLQLVCDGVETGRGVRADYIKRDRQTGLLKGRRGARLAALTSGGAIPDNADYRVLAEPDDTLVGTINEDFAIESMAGDVFLLGSTSWRIRRVERGVVRVVDAQGASPTVPFWLGEAPARTVELSLEVSLLRESIARILEESGAESALGWVAEECGVKEEVAREVVGYLSIAHVALGCLPTATGLVFERFFDETGGMQLVVHAPLGGRINRALGLLLRKRFCRSFDFELQAAAGDDAILLSLGPQHSFPLEELRDSLHPAGIEEALRQAVLPTPMFTVRWRWNLNRFLLVLRFRGGKRNPPQLQRMQADDLMAAIFPSLAACQDNATGPRVIPEHPVVKQTLHDCFQEAMDVEGLGRLLDEIQAGRVQLHFRDTSEPSLLSHEILNSRPYTFLDDAPLEERRARAVSLKRGLPLQARALTALDPEAIRRVRAEAAPAPRDADELHDLLESVVLWPAQAALEPFASELLERGKAHEVAVAGQPFLCAAEWAKVLVALEPRAQVEPPPHPHAHSLEGKPLEAGAARWLRGHLEHSGPLLMSEIALKTALPAPWVAVAVAALEREGSALRGRFDPALEGEQLASRRLLARIHAYTKDRQRREFEPATAQDFLRFLFEWQHVAPGTQVSGKAGLCEVVAQLQGFEAALGVWEPELLSARVGKYDPAWLDELTLSGEVVWGRLSLRALRPVRGASLSRRTPITLALRPELDWLQQSVRLGKAPGEGISANLARVIHWLEARGALFWDDLASRCQLIPAQLEEALWEGVARGLITADGYEAVRRLLRPRHRRPDRSSHRSGRWTLLVPSTPWASDLPGEVSRPKGSATDTGQPSGERLEQLAEAVAHQLLCRYGVVFRDVCAREVFSVPFREVLWALRRLEARGLIRGGRFITGFVGEQYALPEAVVALRAMQRRERDGTEVWVGSHDPLNLVGILTSGARVAPLPRGPMLFRDGLPVHAPVSSTTLRLERLA